MNPKYKHNQIVRIKISGMVEDIPVSVEKELTVKTIDWYEYTDGYGRAGYFRYYLVKDCAFDKNGRWVSENDIVGVAGE